MCENNHECDECFSLKDKNGQSQSCNWCWTQGQSKYGACIKSTDYCPHFLSKQECDETHGCPLNSFYHEDGSYGFCCCNYGFIPNKNAFPYKDLNDVIWNRMSIAEGSYCEPDPCSSYSCEACSKQSKCGWCDSLGLCLTGFSQDQGAHYNTCPNNDWWFDQCLNYDDNNNNNNINEESNNLLYVWFYIIGLLVFISVLAYKFCYKTKKVQIDNDMQENFLETDINSNIVP